VPYDGILLLLPALYFFLDMCFSPYIVHKGKQETSVGEAHLDNITEFDRENHEIQKVMDQEPRQPKLDPNGLRARPPGPLFGSVGPPQCPLATRFVHGQVCGPYVLFSHIILSVSNRIQNPLIKQLKT
jgi:hypothetical protein